MHRRKQRESKRFQKQLQAERLKDKAQQKKSSIEEVSKWRKQREKSVRDVPAAFVCGTPGHLWVEG